MSALSQAQQKKGDALKSEAEATLKKSTWFASSTERKHEDAAELFVKAANAYKVGGWHDEAADAYVRASELFKTLKNLGEASKALSDAGACYKKAGTNITRAIECWSDAVILLCDSGRLNMAAKLSKEIAEALENSAADNEGKNNDFIAAAIESYQKAADLFEMDQAKSQASGCLQKIAELSSGALNPPELLKAADLYESLGRTCLDSNLLKYNAKSHFLNGILCHLANGDSIGASQAYTRFDNLDYTFGESREGKFASQLIEATETFDASGFATACFEYDRISKLDPWKTSMLVKVKRGISDQTGIDGVEGEEGDVDLT
ncbi:hypothetical protein ACHAW6_013272 [Cyclotella cf. meneghiniana]